MSSTSTSSDFDARLMSPRPNRGSGRGAAKATNSLLSHDAPPLVARAIDGLVLACASGCTLSLRCRGRVGSGRIGLRRIDRQLDTDLTTLTNLLKDELHESGEATGAALDVLRTVSTSQRAQAILDPQGMEIAARWFGLRLQDTV